MLSKLTDWFKTKHTSVEIKHKNAPPAPLPPTDDTGSLADQVWSFNSFSALSCSGVVEVEWEASPQTSITAKADQAQLSKLQVSQQNGSLCFVMPEFVSRKPFKITIHSPSLKEVTGLNGAKLTVDGIKGSEFKATQEGSGSVTLLGKIDTLQLIAKGGELDAHQLKSNAVHIQATDHSEVSCFASISVLSSADNYSTILVHGTPYHVEKSAGIGSRVKVFGAPALSKEEPGPGIFTHIPIEKP